MEHPNVVRARAVLVILIAGLGTLVPVLTSAGPADAETPRSAAAHPAQTPAAVPTRTGVSATDGYQLVASDGGVFSFGSATFRGSTGAMPLRQPIVGMAATASGAGYWLVASDGGVFAFGDARFFGSAGGRVLDQPVVGIAATPTGRGYWLAAADGGVFAFGDAAFFGSTGALVLQKPILGIAVTPSGRGYRLVASDGGVFVFGDAGFLGSTGGRVLGRPIVGIADTASGAGYWLVASDGGVFAFGDAAFRGSTGDLSLRRPIVGMAATASGAGYWLVASDGGIFSFGDAAFLGSTGATALNQPVVGMQVTQGSTPAPPPASVTPAATHLAFTTQPSSSTGGTTFATQPAVALLDATGAPVATDTSDVTISLTNPSGATLDCDASHVAAVAGVATFAGCNIDVAGTYTLTATDGVLTTATSSSVTIVAGAATGMTFTTQPSASSVSSTNFAAQPVVTIHDAAGNTAITDHTTAVALQLTSPGGSSLSCGAPVTAVAGVATFSGCNVTLVGSYTLTATGPPLPSTVSTTFAITPGAATALVWTTQPIGGAIGGPWTVQPVLRFVDAFGNTATSSTDIVTIDVVSGPATVDGVECFANPQAAVNGIVTFTQCTINTNASPPRTWGLQFSSPFGVLNKVLTES